MSHTGGGRGGTEFRVTVGKERLVFSAGHFLALGGGACERLHGHTYRVAVTAAGEAGEEAMVVDLLALEEAARSLLAPLDHRVLLPSRSPALVVREAGVEVEVRRAGRRYVFPRADVALLPIAESTAEMLAAWLAEGLLARLAGGPHAIRRLEVEVEESPGQSGHCVRTLPAAPR